MLAIDAMKKFTCNMRFSDFLLDFLWIRKSGSYMISDESIFSGSGGKGRVAALALGWLDLETLRPKLSIVNLVY